MDYIYQESEKPKNKILRQYSMNSVNYPNNSRISKLNSFLKPGLKSDLKNGKVSLVFKDTQITEQLQQQINAIQKCIKNYQPFLRHIREKQQQQTVRQKILALDQIIRSKDKEINLITKEVRHLKNISNPALVRNNNKKNFQQQQNNSSNEPTIKNLNPDSQDNNIFKLADQLKIQRQFLLKLQNQHSTKRSKLKQITSAVQQIQSKYVERCVKTKQRPLMYEEFKELNEQKKRQMEQKAHKRAQKATFRQKQSSIKVMPEFVFNNQPIKTQRDMNTTNTKKSLKSLQNRKIIAEQALKNARKKHNNELTEMMAKLQFLRDQDDLLLQKIREKEEQRILLQSKFNEEKVGAMGSFHMNGPNRLMSPYQRSRENKMKRLESNGLNAKIKRLMTPLTLTSNEKSQDKDKNYFSPHRRLLSSRKGNHETDRSSGDLSRKFMLREGNDKKGKKYETEETNNFDDYEDRNLNRKSKNSNSNKDPSTNENDSHFDRIH